ncbi:helix-turn-helix domain-containing protein [Kaarinaea lacus]
MAIAPSPKSKRHAFNDYYGVSPQQYLKSYRLNAVRKEMIAQNPSHLKITDVANNWGFWHMGQFAQDYKRRFGELPSETMKKLFVK